MPLVVAFSIEEDKIIEHSCHVLPVPYRGRRPGGSAPRQCTRIAKAEPQYKLPLDASFDSCGSVIGLRYSGDDSSYRVAHFGPGSITPGQYGSGHDESDASPVAGRMADRSFGPHSTALCPKIARGHRESFFADFRNHTASRSAGNLFSPRSRSAPECTTGQLGLVALLGFPAANG